MTSAQERTPHAAGVLRVACIESFPAACVDEVIRLGDAHRNTMGHLPFAGFKQSAQRGHIVVALLTATAGYR